MDVTFRVSNLFGRFSRQSLSADNFQHFRTVFVAIRQVLKELRSFEISFSNIQGINPLQGTFYQLWVITHEGNVQIRSFSTVKVLAFNYQFVARVKSVVLCILRQRQLIAGTMYDGFHSSVYVLNIQNYISQHWNIGFWCFNMQYVIEYAVESIRSISVTVRGCLEERKTRIGMSSVHTVLLCYCSENDIFTTIHPNSNIKLPK
jgi:hypothetical protein